MAELADTAAPVAAPPPDAAASPAEAAKGEDELASSYPPPQAGYEEVVASEGLFMETLVRLHGLLGTKFKVPRIGGKSLDLHRLFVEVTSRGGLQKVVNERKWKEIIALFKFPSTITSASYVLRKYYISLLYHYEQVYFFRNRRFMNVLDENQSGGTSAASESHSKVTMRSPKACPPEDALVVTGKIIAKFDHGYMVVANFGSEALEGFLYHVPSETIDEETSDPDACRIKQKRPKKAQSNPSWHKSNGGPSNFIAEPRRVLNHPPSGEESAVIRQMDSMWNNLTATEEVYPEQRARGKKRYSGEVVEYGMPSNASQGS